MELSHLSQTQIGTPSSSTATRLVLLGSGELGREVAIEAMRLGCEVVAFDRYQGAPAMQIAHSSKVVDMTNGEQLEAALREEIQRPHSRLLIVPELEAIATDVLVKLEAEGATVVPTATATKLTMNREGIRRLAAEQLGLPTSPYQFCDSQEQLAEAADKLGFPCVVKPVMSSSGKGQSLIKSADEVAAAWEYAQSGGRVGAGRVICEGFVDFDYEITQLTVRHAAGTSFCEPIGHIQVDGDYRESWQPQQMTSAALTAAREVAEKITTGLGGFGIFGVELFIKGDQVIFSEVSPRPHDTGMATMASQAQSQFALHVRAILGLPIPVDANGTVPMNSPGASAVVLAKTESEAPNYGGIGQAYSVDPSVQVRIFAKPDGTPGRRLGVCLAAAGTADEARILARSAAEKIVVAGLTCLTFWHLLLTIVTFSESLNSGH